MLSGAACAVFATAGVSLFVPGGGRDRAPTAVETPAPTALSTPSLLVVPPDSGIPALSGAAQPGDGRTTTGTSPSTPDSALPGVVAPIRAASDEGEWIGSIEIPALDILRYMFEGVQLTTLDIGPGHWPGTALPGDDGNAVFAGHRTSEQADFADLHELEPGDEVIFQTADEQRHVYVVESTEIVDPSALWIADQTVEPTATLFACHPPGSVSQRIVVRLSLDT